MVVAGLGVRMAGRMRVQVDVIVAVVRVAVSMDAGAARRGPQRSDAEDDEHDRHDRLQPARDDVGDAELQGQHHRATGQQRERVAEPPEPAHERRAGPAAALAHERRDGDQVVGVQGVAQAEHEAQAGRGQERRVHCRPRSYTGVDARASPGASSR